MALAKPIKIGGSYYKGYELIVSATPGDYVLDMQETAGAVINSISMVPDEYGAGDKFKLTHLTQDKSTTRAVLAEDIYNPGANVPTVFDFPAAEDMRDLGALRLTYTNTAGLAVNLHVIVEYVGIVKTS